MTTEKGSTMDSFVRFTNAALLLIALVAVSCRKSGTEGEADKTPPVNVRVEILKPTSLVDAIQVAGTVKAYEDVSMSPEEGGVVKEWKINKGGQVRKGSLIVVLHDEVLKASLDAAEAQAKMADLNVQSQQGVYEQQGISELQFRNLQYSRDAARANADLMRARWERTQLRSPIDGLLDYTGPNGGEFAPPGVPIARVVNTSVIKIQADVPEKQASAVMRGATAIATFDALPGDTLTGKVSFVSATVSAANRAVTVEIVVSNPFRKLKPDMVAKVRLLRAAKKNALLVSENVVQLVDRDRVIVYVENNGKAEERRLTLGGRQGNMVEVVEGLAPGDRVVVVGYEKLVNGSPVTVTQ